MTAPDTRPPRTGTTFQALHNRVYRRYLGGQVVSLCGTWMQTVAQGWLVLELSHSGTALGLVTALQFLPVLLFGPYGGLIADRVDRRRLLLFTQSTLGALALLLGLLDLSGSVRLWMVYVVAFGFGLVACVDNPTRQSFVLEMVEPKDLTNAVTLNSVMVNAARAVGPGIAGILIGVSGPALCFLVNAGSFVAVIIALVSIRPSSLRTVAPVVRAKGQVREGLAYVARTPMLRGPLIMMAVIGTLAYEFPVVLPLLAKNTFDGDAGAYGWLTSAMGVGAVLGGLTVARLARTTALALVVAAAGFGGVMFLAAAAPTLPVAIAAMVPVGAGSVAFLALGNSTLQLAADPAMRGRVMALWTVAFLGSTPVGGPLIGWISQQFGPRTGLVVGGVAAVGAAAYGARTLLRRPAADVPPPPGPNEPVLALRAADPPVGATGRARTGQAGGT